MYYVENFFPRLPVRHHKKIIVCLPYFGLPSAPPSACHHQPTKNLSPEIIFPWLIYCSPQHPDDCCFLFFRWLPFAFRIESLSPSSIPGWNFNLYTSVSAWSSFLIPCTMLLLKMDATWFARTIFCG